MVGIEKGPAPGRHASGGWHPFIKPGPQPSNVILSALLVILNALIVSS